MKIGELALNRDVSKDNYLELSNGKTAKSLKDLLIFLEEMEDEDFFAHVSSSHNEFRDWIMDAYGDVELAKRVGKTRRRKKVIKVIASALKNGRRSNAHEINVPRRKKDILDQIREAAKA